MIEVFGPTCHRLHYRHWLTCQLVFYYHDSLLSIVYCFLRG
jgi:hypothetical protein